MSPGVEVTLTQSAGPVCSHAKGCCIQHLFARYRVAYTVVTRER
jgi:hypothetical protein